MTKKPRYRPTLEELDLELRRVRSSGNRRKWLRALLVMLVVALLAGGYLSSEQFALMRVRGDGMRDTLRAGDVVFLRRNAEILRGDIVAFERDGALMIRRVISLGGDQVSISFDGTAYINGVGIEESYLFSRSLGKSNVAYPLTVPAGQMFVMGDHRVVAVDSRSQSVGMVSQEEIVGRVEARVWPVERIGGV